VRLSQAKETVGTQHDRKVCSTM